MKLKYVYFILLTTCWNFSSGQENYTFKVLNALTNEPLEKVYIYLLEEEDKFIDINETDTNGLITLTADDFNPNTYYLIDITEDGYLPFRQKITSQVKEIRLLPDVSYKPKNLEWIYLDCSYIEFGDYEPLEPKSMEDIAEPVRSILENHLINRLGKNYYSKLYINGGQIVNIERMHIVDPETKDYHWTPYSFYICFSFQDTLNGIGLFTATIVLDKHGKIIEEIELPPVAKNPEKSNHLPLEKIKGIATSNGFSSDSCRIEIDYDKKTESICWIFSKGKFEPDHTFTQTSLMIDAHSGTIIRTFSSGGTWD